MAGPPNNTERRRNSEFQISELNQTVDKSKYHLSDEVKHAFSLVTLT